jgi:predicted tellurium resistance membrane protein TerC
LDALTLFTELDTWIALLTLTFLEVVLGIDNIIFISIVSNKLPEHKRGKARRVGLLLALVTRILLLLGITFIIQFTQPIITVLDFELSGRDLILSVGGLFLLAKSTTEIHNKIEGETEESQKNKAAASFLSVIIQIIFLDIIFSFDSILTAVGLTDHVIIMIIAVIISIFIMIAFAGPISDFINEHPTLQILALSFLILIGFMLVLEGLHFHVPKGYIYFAVAYSLGVEVLNMRIRGKKKKMENV